MLELQTDKVPCTFLGWGSNTLPSDAGVPGAVVRNVTNEIRIDGENGFWVDSGVGFQELFLRTVQLGFGGLEFGVGIPGTVGGALVSNAGAYRSNIAEFVQELEIVHDARRKVVSKSWMKFRYRDSALRDGSINNCAILAVRIELPRTDAKASYDEARNYQIQRIAKQPPSPSAGSVFKNVTDHALAARLEGLPQPLKEKGIIPAGYLIEQCGLKGMSIGGASIGKKHANFIINDRGASASDIRSIAHVVKKMVHRRFGVTLEEEVLYIGDWSQFTPIEP
jgi:UDP-N-acetylmuramate dehydrogenase